MRKLIGGFGLIVVVGLASFVYVEWLNLNQSRARLANVEQRLLRQQQVAIREMPNVAPVKRDMQLFVSDPAVSAEGATREGDKPAATLSDPAALRRQSEKRSPPAESVADESFETPPPGQFQYVDTTHIFPGETEANQIRKQISESEKQIRALKARREMLMENPTHAATLQAELQKVDSAMQAWTSMHKALAARWQVLEQSKEDVAQRSDKVRRSTPAPADMGDREQALKESVRKAAKLREAAKSLAEAGDTNAASTLNEQARAIQENIARQRAEIERRRAEIAQTERDSEGRDQRPGAIETGAQAPWQQVLREIRELRGEVKALRQEIVGLRGAGSERATVLAAPPSGRMAQETITRDGRQLHVWRWIPVEPSQPQPAVSADAPTFEPLAVPARNGEEKAAPPTTLQPSGSTTNGVLSAQPGERTAPISPPRKDGPGASPQNPAANFIRRILSGVQPTPKPEAQLEPAVIAAPTSTAAAAGESVKNGTFSTTEVSPGRGTTSPVEPRPAVSTPGKDSSQPGPAENPTLTFEITSDVDHSQPNSPTKYSINVVGQTATGDVGKPLLDSGVYPIEKWESFFKAAAEGCRKNHVEPSAVNIEVRVDRETPQRHIQKLLKLAHDNGFRKTRVHAFKDEPKKTTTE